MTGNLRLILTGIIVTLVLVVGGTVWLSAGQQPIEREKLGTASLSLDKTFVDLGNMQTEEEKTASFEIVNTSDNILRIWKVKTSCDCTFAKVKIGDQESGEFSMHAKGPLANWIGEIPVGEKAELKVIYRPFIMPVSGVITRQVSFYSNDPKNESVEITIQANVL